LAIDLKSIYHAPNEQVAYNNLDNIANKWKDKYPNAMKRWHKNWDAICPIFKFSQSLRKIIYTTNAIESLNSTYRRLNRSRSVFPNDLSLLKALYLSTLEATKKWDKPVNNWGKVLSELEIFYEDRISE
jgi:transposase-like protein